MPRFYKVRAIFEYGHQRIRKLLNQAKVLSTIDNREQYMQQQCKRIMM